MHRVAFPKPVARCPLVLASRARQMRHCPTPSEERLWRALAAGRLGVHFRRQVPLLGRYIVDLLAPAARLVVEVDGGYHGERRAADERRDRVLERAGYRVARIEAAVVERSVEEAVGRVAAALADAAE